jgi:uncharacterized OsmC-like protein
MDAAELRAMQAPIKDRYKTDAGAALITLKAKGSLDDSGIACKVETGRALATAGLHPATGGSGLELCSGDMLLEALVACAGVTLRSVATALKVPIRHATVDADDRTLAKLAELTERYCVVGQSLRDPVTFTVERLART